MNFRNELVFVSGKFFKLTTEFVYWGQKSLGPNVIKLFTVVIY
jgi:hypothetical protein